MMKISILGTGDVGRALGNAFVTLGHEVRMGSRSATNEKALAWAAEMGPKASAGTFADAAGFGEIIVLATLGSTATWIFVLTAAIIISFYGGGFSTVPAYLRDLFGTFQVGAIHGRLLTAWSAAGIAGPLIVNAFLDAQGKPGQLTAASYQPALLTMVGLLVIGFAANLLVKPVDARFHEPRPDRVRAEEPAMEA